MQSDHQSVDMIQSAFRTAMRGFASTVSVVTACDHERMHGMTVTSVTSLSMDPPSVLVCIHRQTLLHDIVLRAPRFGVNVLGQDQAGMSTAFSGGTPPQDRFAVGDWRRSDAGVPYLLGAQANLLCRKSAAIPYGTHVILVGEVEHVELSQSVSPLVYHNAAYCIASPAA